MRKNSPLGEVIIELAEIDSTNNYAMKLINEGMSEHGLAIRADVQTEGRGQQGNTWQSEESKNLLMSVILDTEGFELEHQFRLSAAACLSVADLLMQYFMLKNISIKWPNDIYAGNKKISGILIENVVRGTHWTHTVIGIGINVNQANFKDLNRATSILNETGKNTKMPLVLKQLFKHLNHYFDLFVKDSKSLMEQYNQMLYGYQKNIMYVKKHENLSGTVLGVNESGCLMIESEGRKKTYKHKDIEIVLS